MWGVLKEESEGEKKKTKTTYTHILHEKTKYMGTEATEASVRPEACIQECKHLFEHRNQRSSPYVGQDEGENVG